MDLKLLEEIGLTPGEVKVYLALLKLGPSKTGPLCAAAGVSSSKIYKILDRLHAKGLAGHVIIGKAKHFAAMQPRCVLDYMDEKQARLAKDRKAVEGMVGELERMQEKAGVKTEVFVYEGFRGVTNLFRGMLADLKAGEEYYVIGAGYGENVPGLRPFFHNHHLRRSERRIGLKMLANHDQREALEASTKLKAEIRYLPQYLITNMEIAFYKNKVIMALWTREPKGFLIESEEAVKNFQKYFNSFWKIAKP
ncbi:HTH-type sugar sensing transcriptional regulator TrmBL1 [Candidatus Burarchaeum australiense]|nr:HTH-type sugar sensing transcriptional regulator TrmBL1 [Candidatus Burarchaeum australiense]